MKHNKLLSACIFLSISACTPIKPADPSSCNHQNLNVHEKLHAVAQSVDCSLRTLAQAQAQDSVNCMNTAPLLTAQGGMYVCAKLDWSGPIEPLLYELGRVSNYQVKLFGNPPPIPIIVSIVADKKNIADVLKDAGLQAGKRANLVVYPESHIIELRYAAI